MSTGFAAIWKLEGLSGAGTCTSKVAESSGRSGLALGWGPHASPAGCLSDPKWNTQGFCLTKAQKSHPAILIIFYQLRHLQSPAQIDGWGSSPPPLGGGMSAPHCKKSIGDGRYIGVTIFGYTMYSHSLPCSSYLLFLLILVFLFLF